MTESDIEDMVLKDDFYDSDDSLNSLLSESEADS